MGAVAEATMVAVGVASPGGISGRLLWRCRRGMKELDVILERFAREALAGATPAEWRAFERLLGLPDPLLAGYFLGNEPPADPELRALAARIRDLCHGSSVC
jgi:antitoxin CptB